MRVLAPIAAALAFSGSAPAAAPQPVTIQASDGVALACSLLLPDGTPPAAGWPAVLLFEPSAVQAVAAAGYASLACDARGTGGSGGRFGLAGPRDVQDVRELFAWLTARPDVSDTDVGALGGGIVWNAAVAGVPFKAIVPVDAWTSLAAALAPQGLAKSGFAANVPRERWEPELLGPVAAFAPARSAAGRLRSLTTPALVVQARRDPFLDVEQALAAFRALQGPKRVYIGNLPLTLAVKWFDRFLEGTANGVDRNVVDLEHDPADGRTTTFTGVPPTRTISVSLPGTTTLSGPTAKVVRAVRFTGGPHETFGRSSVSVRYANAASWDRLVAVVAAGGETIAAGGVELTAPSGTATIALPSQVLRLAAGKRVTLSLASTGAFYREGVQQGAQITIGRATLTLSVLRRAVSPAAAAAVLALAGPALATGRPTVAVWHSATSTSVHYVVPKDAEPIAALTTFAPSGYRLDLSRPPGTTIGTVTADAFSRANNLTLPLGGTVVTDAPARYTERSKVCAQTPASAAVWLLNLSLAGQTLTIPAYVNPTAGADAAFGAYRISICLPPWDVPESQGGSPQGAQILDATLTVVGIAPPASGMQRWETLFTPYTRGKGTANVPGTFEARAFVPLPVGFGLRATRTKASGRATEAGKPLAGVRVTILTGPTPGKLRKAATATTDASGSFSRPLRLQRYARATGAVGERDYTDAGCADPATAIAPAGCVSATLAPWSATSALVQIRG